MVSACWVVHSTLPRALQLVLTLGRLECPHTPRGPFFAFFSVRARQAETNGPR